jgi:hypothetical protein
MQHFINIKGTWESPPISNNTLIINKNYFYIFIAFENTTLEAWKQKTEVRKSTI